MERLSVKTHSLMTLGLLSLTICLSTLAVAGDWMEPDKAFMAGKGFSTETQNVLDDYMNRMQNKPTQNYPTKRRMYWYNLWHNQLPASTKPFGSYTFDNNQMPTQNELDSK